MKKRFRLHEKIFLPENGFAIIVVAIAIFYGIIPISIAISDSNGRDFSLLAALTTVSIMAMWVGNRLNIFDNRFNVQAKRLVISSTLFISVVWLFFLIFIIITMSTASAIPIIGALSGLDANVVSQQRGEFLKGRDGIGIVLLYISTFMSTFVPYTIVLLYESRSKYRHLAVIIFLLYAVSFMVKALFLVALLPIIVYFAVKRRLNFKIFLSLALFGSLLLIYLTIISLGGDYITESAGDFFTAQYVPANPLSYFIWRLIGVPVFTATDTLTVYLHQFNGQPLMGATSNFIAGIFGLDRVNLERFVFEYQFGSWNETANANAVFIADAYVNFGWIGVVLFGIIVGQVFRWFRRSNDVAFKSQWINFALLLFSASLIGTLLSNMWALLLVQSIFVQIKQHGKHTFQ